MKVLHSVLLLLIVFLTFSQLAAAINPASEIGRWRLDDNLSVTDLEENRDLRAINGVPIQEQTIGGTLFNTSNFDTLQGGYYNNGSANLFNGSIGFSFVMWANISPSVSNIGIIAGTTNASLTGDGPGWGIMSTNPFGIVRIAYLHNSTTIINTTESLNINQWHMLSVVVNSSAKQIWVDDILNVSNNNGELPLGTNGFSIGSSGNISSDIWPGNLYCGRFFNESLSDSNIRHLYNGGVPNCQDLENVTLDAIELNTCVGGSENATINFTIFSEEDTNFALTSEVEAEFDLYVSDPDVKKTATFDLSGSSSYLFCLPHPNDEIRGDAFIRYTPTTGFTHRWILNKQDLSNETLAVDAGNTNTTASYSNLQGTVRDKSGFEEKSGVIASLQRRYTGEGLWRTVQMDKTGDFGAIFFNIIEESQEYRLIFQNDNNVILRQTNTLKFICESGICTINFLIDDILAGADIGLQVSDAFDNVTNIVTVTWLDPTAGENNVHIRVTKETFSTTTTICSETQIGFSGTFTCNTTGLTPPFLLQVGRARSPDVFQISKQIGQTTSALRELIGNPQEIGLVAGLIMVTAGTAGAAAGVGIATILIPFALIIIWFLDIFTFLNVGLLLAVGIGTAVIVARTRGAK